MQELGSRPLHLPTATSIGQMGSYDSWVFCGSIGEMRGVVGLHVALIAVRNGLDVESDLAIILPAEDVDSASQIG